ncbi:DNA modification system-associated small protein [Methylobacillus sp. Pita1]|uniref:DNA modification system-associated small protein n=1 Tax=Methylobacillus sp. Pita1 TaxID=3382642 RepID=UPI0038B6908C
MTETYLGDLPLWADEEAKALLEKLCIQYEVPSEVFAELVAIQRERQNQEKAWGVYDSITEVLGRID